MSKKIKGFISVFLCFVLIFSLAVPTFASKKNDNKINHLISAKGFKDVPKSHWAYDYIMWMYQNNFISGIGNEKFNPNGTLTRAQFAKMMVNTLDLELVTPKNPTFIDVAKKDWEYSFVESSLKYLTAYTNPGGGLKFKPDEPAVREDMAVALVKALGYQNESIDESILNQFADSSEINPKLRRHAALSVKYGLMQGYTKNGKLYFGAQDNLTRAQASALLYRAFKVKEEKIPFDEDKIPFDDDEDEDNEDEEAYVAPVVSASVENGILILKWSKIDSPKFKEYRVVISKNDSTPRYPENGYLYTITDPNRTIAVINNNDEYNSGDFGKYLTKGEKYYFSVTAVYDDGRAYGNTVRMQYNGTENPELYVMPVVTASEENGKLVLRWNKIESSNFVSYRVVASKNDSSPSYPENGYLFTITDRNKNYAVIDNSTAYTNGDFGGYFIKGEAYYFNITAEYKDRTVVGNTIKVRYKGADNPKLFPAPKVSAEYVDGKLMVSWDKIDSEHLLGYRVVISKNTEAPAYPANGYYDVAYDKDTTSVVIDASKPYTSGDFTALTFGEEYYFSVTAVYAHDKYVAGNAVKKLYLVETEQ
jgi:hypothetical protein